MIAGTITVCLIGLSAIWWTGHSSDPLNSRMVLGKAEMDARPNDYYESIPDQCVTGMAAADIAFSGVIRLFTVGFSSNWNQGWLTMWMYDGNGTFTKVWEVNESGVGDYTHRPLTVPALGDLDGDGTMEIVVAWGRAKSVKVHESENGNPGNREWLFQDDDDIYYSSPAIGDVDDDGKLEVVIGTEAGNLYVCEYNSWGQQTFAVPAPFPGAAVRSSPALADLDGNGVLDIVFCVSHKTSGTDQAYVYAYTWNG
ncbi:MAG: VCBS repeat-containing protein [candidate division WOR-3 bacterium]